MDFASGCDPAGAVFDDTLGGLGELERAAFRFAGSANLAGLRWLFVFGAGQEVTDTNGTTLLHAACRTGSFPIVQELVSRGLPLDAMDCAGWTPLHVASCVGRQDVSVFLLQNGAPSSFRNAKGQTPKDVSCQTWSRDVVRISTSKSRPVRPAREGEGNSLHFEPFFVPREAPFEELTADREELHQLGVELLDLSPGHGIAFVVALGIVRDYPVEINNFVVRTGIDPARFCDFLGEEYPIAQTLRLEFLNSLPLLWTGALSALQVLFTDLAIPKDWQKVDRLIRGCAHFWWRRHEEGQEKPHMVPRDGIKTRRGEVTGLDLQKALIGVDSLHRLMFSSLMLYKWLRSGKHMSLGSWVQLNMGIDSNGGDVPAFVQKGIYEALQNASFVLGKRRRPKLVPSFPLAMEGWAFVQYSGRAQMGPSSHPGACLDVSPQLLAAQGGALSAGRSAPLPFSSGSPVLEVAKRFDARSALPQGEVTWLSLRRWILLLYAHSSDSAPYGFVPLRHAFVREKDADEMRLVIANRMSATWSPVVTGGDDWLDLCLLLGDGRFQMLEAPYLELSFEDSFEFETWVSKLQEACSCEIWPKVKPPYLEPEGEAALREPAE